MMRLSALELPTLADHRTAPRACPGGAPLAAYVDLPRGEEPLTLVPRSTPTDRASRSAPPRAWSSGCTTDYPGTHRLGGDRAQGRRQRRRRRRGCRRRHRPRLHHQRRPAAALPGVARCARRAARPAAWPASSSPPAIGWSSSGPSTRPPTTVVVTSSGLVRRPARHRGRRAQGDAVCRVPRQGPRPPAACAATGSSRARTPSCSPGPAATPARAAGANGVAVELPAPTGERDGSGTPGTVVIAAIAPARTG